MTQLTRRELIMATCAGAASQLGVSVEAKPIESDPLPLMIVVTVPADASHEIWQITADQFSSISEWIHENTGERIPFVVVPEGIDVDAVIDPRK